MAKKPNMGRQKIKIAKIETKNHLQVTFSKRRSGVFKKASELCTLCGVEIAIIVFSPAGKAFSFGHPNVDPILDRFLSRNPHPVSGAALHLAEAHRSAAAVCEMSLQLTQVLAASEMEKKRGEMVGRMREERRSRQYWWEAPITELGLPELEQVMIAMDELKKNVASQIGKIMAAETLLDLEETKSQRIMINTDNNTLLLHHQALQTYLWI
ncbi:PREDICTED: agamous-like MADS-box protein AGL61 [Ipomoea nil]|uniref:agamous-like MADS-box protein AGL61 n=1 Tax=Ipomoea nil TaxID=35883 RepID=UPI00090143FD|nr:PREDICTED: agamous-like MADS-box protein AGL61 [Ipomoea nil]